MFVRIELLAGPNKNEPTKIDIERNMASLDRAIRGCKLSCDDVPLLDTMSILEGIRKELP